jgi:hypothetical protein
VYLSIVQKCQISHKCFIAEFTIKITHLRGSVDAFPAVQAPHVSSNKLSLQHQRTSTASEWFITRVEVTTNPQAVIPTECPTAHITMGSLINIGSVIP